MSRGMASGSPWGSVDGRLLAGETDELKAFTDSKKVLRAKYTDPFHWVPSC